ncbi:MAG: helix-turn-helix transcriptional regulator [Oscillospiraceae bacterium]|nr:helix-turn-helix transcriptional regulator [Oscillospiraceae bacterium]
MIITKEISLLDCGEQTKYGSRLFTSRKDKNYLLLMCGVRSVLRINDKQYYMQPFTFLLYPFGDENLLIESHEATFYRYMHLRFTDGYLKKLQESGLTLLEVHTLAQPLAIEEIWKILLPFMEENYVCSQEMGEHALRLLMCLLMEGSDGTVSKAAEIPHYDKLTALRHKIYANPANSWYIQDICDEIGISRPYFHKLYLAAFGTTCTQDVIASRIAYSKKLLAGTNHAVASISQQCGFETDVYFMRQFKRHVGMTPTAYRRVQSANKTKK